MVFRDILNGRLPWSCYNDVSSYSSAQKEEKQKQKNLPGQWGETHYGWLYLLHFYLSIFKMGKIKGIPSCDTWEE